MSRILRLVNAYLLLCNVIHLSKPVIAHNSYAFGQLEGY